MMFSMEAREVCAAVLFDLDGVLVSTDEHHYAAWKRIADEERIPFERGDNDRLRGVSRMACVDIILEKAGRPYDDEEKRALAERKNGYYTECLGALGPADILPGVRDLLDELQSRGVRIAVGSSSRNARIILKKLGLLDRFDAVIDGSDISRSKPDPEVFLRAAKKLNIPPHRCVVVEDAEAGLAAAAAAGMRHFALGSAAGSPLAKSAAPDLARARIDDILDPRC